MADEYRPVGTPEDKVQGAPDNVVADNTGKVPVQPVATTDPTLDDNTNPRVPFDGADPRNIPPHDSNEQLHIAAGKRMGADVGDLTTAAGTRRKAVEAAYDKSKDVRDVLDGDTSAEAGRELTEKATAQTKADAEAGARTQPPQGRQTRADRTTKS